MKTILVVCMLLAVGFSLIAETPGANAGACFVNQQDVTGSVLTCASNDANSVLGAAPLP